MKVGVGLKAPYLYVLVTAGLLFGFAAHLHADIELPPPLNTPEEIAKYVENLQDQEPWIPTFAAKTQYPAELTTVVANEQKLIQLLKATPGYLDALAERPPLISIRLQKLKAVKEESLLLKKELAAHARQVAVRILTEALQTDGSIDDFLDKKTEELYSDFSKQNVDSLITGLIRSLPDELQAQAFALGDPEEQIHYLENEAALTEAQVQNNFAFAEHSLESTENSKTELIESVRNLLKIRDALYDIVLTRWICTQAKAVWNEEIKSPEDVESMVESVPLENLTPQTASQESKIEFLKSLAALVAPKPDKPTRRRLQKLLELFTKDAFEKGEIDATKATNTVILREVPPWVGIFRGFAGNDCATSHSFAAPYSPYERVFLAENEEGELIGYASGTIVSIGDDKGFFLHDLTGDAMTTDDAELIVYGLYKLLPELGATRLTFPTNKNIYENVNNEAVRAYWQGELAKTQQVEQTYFDTAFRDQMAQVPAGLHVQYDAPQTHKNVHEFLPNEIPQISAEARQQDGLKVISADASIAEQLINAFQRAVVSGEEKTSVEIEGIDAKKLQALIALLLNKDELELAEYYEKLRIALAEHEIELSNKFIKENERLFWGGHFRAPDTLTVEDPEFWKRTVRFVLASIKKGTDRQSIYKLIAKNKDRFANDNRFLKYISEIDGTRENDAEIIEEMESLGFDLSKALGNPDVFLNILDRRNPEAIKWALSKFRDVAKKKNAIPVATLKTIASFLDNSDHDDDKLSYRAVQFLLRAASNDPDIIEELEITAEDEENVRISFRAAVAILKSGTESDIAVVHIDENLKNKKLPEKLRAYGKRLIKKFDVKTCAQNLANRDPEDIPQYEDEDIDD